MLQYLDGSLDAKDLPELNQCLRSQAGLLDEFAQLLIMDLHLRDIAREQKAAAAANTKPQRQPSRARFSVEELWGSWSLWQLGQLGWRRALALGVGFAAVAVCLFLFAPRGHLAIQPRLADVKGRITIERSGRRWVASSGLRLRTGDRLQLDRQASAMIRYPDEGTWFSIWDLSEVRIQQSENIRMVSLQSGTLSAGVAPRGKPSLMRFTTPQAEVGVSGGEFTLAAGPEATRLEVWAGMVRLTRVEDGAAADVVKGEFALAQHGPPPASAAIRYGLLRERWLGPNQPGATNSLHSLAMTNRPSTTEYLVNFEAPSAPGGPSLARVRGYVRPPVSGAYRFWLAADDQAELWLSADDKPEHSAKVCWTTQQTDPSERAGSASRQSPPIMLQAGRTYYIEILQRERGGAEPLAVTWLAPGGRKQVVPGDYLLPPSGRAADVESLSGSQPR
jgi:PA14 domain/FecR protein